MSILHEIKIPYNGKLRSLLVTLGQFKAEAKMDSLNYSFLISCFDVSDLVLSFKLCHTMIERVWQNATLLSYYKKNYHYEASSALIKLKYKLKIAHTWLNCQ